MNDLDPAQQQEGVSDDASTVTDPQVTEEVAESPEESGEGSGEKGESHGDHPAAEFEVVIEGREREEPVPKDSAAWARMRKSEQEAKARAAELERRLSAYEQPSQVPDPGPKPKLEDFGFDEEKCDEAKDRWREAKARKEAADSAAAKRAEAETQEWNSRLNAHAIGATELAKQVAAYPAAEAAVARALNPYQRAALLQVANNSPLVVCAIGQDPKLLEDLAKETNLLRFGVRISNLEASVKKNEKKNQVPPPEKPINGSGSKSGGDKTLEQLRAKADKTGDRTPVTDYLRNKRSAK